MKQSTSYNKFIDSILDESCNVEKKEEIKKTIIKERENHDKTINFKIKIVYSVVIIILFLLSYCILVYACSHIFEIEIELIKKGLLDAKDRSINSTVVTALIAGTIAQTGAAFYVVTKHLFQIGK